MTITEISLLVSAIAHLIVAMVELVSSMRR
jgi:hypothetical protein